MAEINYSTIERPYNAQMQRSGETLSIGESTPSSQDASSSTYSSDNTPSASIKQSIATGVNGSVEIQPVKADGAMGDVWITNFIRSQNWKPKSTGFYIDGQTGYAEFTNVYVSGNIQALTGSVGGFVIGSDYVRDSGNTFGLASTVTGSNDVRLWAGSTFDNRDTAPFRVYEDGSIAGTGLTITKIDLPDVTTVASFHVDTAGNTWWGANVATGYATAPASVLSTGVVKFVSGTIGGNVLSTTSIGSSTFVSGPLGTGWNISSTGSAEFQNVTIRGSIRTSVFEKDTISAVNGIVLVSKADILSTDMTALDSSTFTISGQTLFAANEVVRIKDGTDDEWMLITNAASAPTYTVTRDLAGAYAPNSNPVWKKGTAVVSMGVGTGTKTGYISLDSTSANSPFIDVYGRNSNTYTDTTLHARIGWLKGITDTAVGLNTTDTWGLYSDNVYLKGTINASAGKIGSASNYWNITANGITAVSIGTDVYINYGKTDFDNTQAGFILGYDYSASLSKFYIGNTTDYFNWTGSDITISGNIVIGTTNSVKGGQSAYKTGNGFFFGYDSTNELDQVSTVTYSPWDSVFADGTTTQLGQQTAKIVGTDTVKEIHVQMKKVSSNTGTIYCDIYAVYNTGSIFIPTGASLGQASVAGITNSTYAEVIFSFPSAVSLPFSSYGYFFVFSSPSTTTGINIYSDASSAAYPLPSVSYYSGAWHSLGPRLGFQLYTQTVGYKMSIGNSTYQMSYNTQNVSLTSNLIVRDPNDSTTYATYGPQGTSTYSRGQVTSYIDNSNGIKFFTGSYSGTNQLLQFSISPTYSLNNNVFLYSGMQFKTGYNYNSSLFLFQNSTGGAWWTLSASSGYGIIIGGAQAGSGRPSNSLGQVEIGSSANKASAIWSYALSACPIPAVENALGRFKTMSRPKLKEHLKDPDKAHYEHEDKVKNPKARKYYDVDDVPDEITWVSRIGEKDIDIIRTTGFLFSAVHDLHDELEALKDELDALKKKIK